MCPCLALAGTQCALVWPLLELDVPLWSCWSVSRHLLAVHVHIIPQVFHVQITTAIIAASEVVYELATCSVGRLLVTNR